jgi:hypothetical protein
VRGCQVTNCGEQNAPRLPVDFVRLAAVRAASAQQLAAMSIQRAQESGRISFGSTTPASTSPTAKSPSTPPILLTPTPLTPPYSEQKTRSRIVLEEIIQEIENRKIGRGSTKTWLRFRLSPIDYKHLQKRYQEDWFFQEKLRYVAALKVMVPNTIC